jgi:hypothetical protein
LEIGFSLKADVDASAAANFKAKMEVFKKSMISIALGTFKLKGLVTGDAELGIEPPTAQILTQVTAIGQAMASGDLNIDIPVFRIGCAIAAASDATAAISGIKADVAGTIKGQADMMAMLKL